MNELLWDFCNEKRGVLMKRKKESEERKEIVMKRKWHTSNLAFLSMGMKVVNHLWPSYISPNFSDFCKKGTLGPSGGVRS